MFNLSSQANTYLIILTITTIINLICLTFIGGMWGFLGYFLYFLITVPFVLLAIYNIDCLTSGNCQIWSWIVTVLISLSMIITTIVVVVVAVMGESNTVQTPTKQNEPKQST
jgi:hypothetical protein